LILRPLWGNSPVDPLPDRLTFDSGHSATIELMDSVEDIAKATVELLSSPTVALSGGGTYASLLALWAELKPRCAATTFFPVDERMVPFDSPDSNWGAAHRLFFEKLALPGARANHPLTLEQFRRQLQLLFTTPIPRFDTIFLGVGEDGHTASLFPKGAYLDDRTSAVLQTLSPKPPHDRLTLGPSTLIAADSLIFVIAGNAKSKIIRQILERDLSLPPVQILAERRNSRILIEKTVFQG